MFVMRSVPKLPKLFAFSNDVLLDRVEQHTVRKKKLSHGKYVRKVLLALFKKIHNDAVLPH